MSRKHLLLVTDKLAICIESISCPQTKLSLGLIREHLEKEAAKNPGRIVAQANLVGVHTMLALYVEKLPQYADQITPVIEQTEHALREVRALKTRTRPKNVMSFPLMAVMEHG